MVGSTDCQQDCQHKSIYRLCSKPIGFKDNYIFVCDTFGELYIFAQLLLVTVLCVVVGVIDWVVVTVLGLEVDRGHGILLLGHRHTLDNLIFK